MALKGESIKTNQRGCKNVRMIGNRTEKQTQEEAMKAQDDKNL